MRWHEFLRAKHIISHYLEDEKSRNWILVGTGISDTGSGKIHHRNKMVERVYIIFKELDKMFRVEQYKLG